MPPKPKQPTLEQMRVERNALMISKSDPERLAELKAKILYIEYGIK